MKHAGGEPTLISKRRWWLLLAAWGLYGLTFLPLYHLADGAAIALALVPAWVTSWLWGITGGALSALLTLPVNLALLVIGGQPSGHALSGEGLVIWAVTVAAVVLGGWLSQAASWRGQRAPERRQIDRTLQRQNLHLRNLLETAEMLTSTLRFGPLLDKTLDQLREIAPYDAASILLVHDAWAQIAQCRGWHPAQDKLRISLEEHPWINRVVSQKCPVGLSPGQEGLEMPMEAGGTAPKSWLGVPLTARDRVIGALTLASGTQVYDESTVRLVTAFAHQTALALENSRLYEQTRSQLREVTVLQGVTSAISSTLDVEQILPYVARSLCRMLSSTSVEIYSLGTDAHVATVAASYATDAATDEEQSLPCARHETWQNDPFTAKALREQRPLEARLEDPDLPAATSAKLRARRAKAALLLPIVSRDSVLGYAYVWDSSSSRRFTEGEMATGQTLIHQTAIAMENARLIRESQRRANHLTAAADVARRVAAIGDPASLLDAVVDLIEERFGFRLAAVLLADEVERELYPTAATDDFWDIIPESYRQPIGRGAIGTAAQTGEVVSIPDTSQDKTAYRVGDWFSPSSLSVPIKMGGLVIGVLQVEADGPNAFDESDRIALEVIADQIAIAHQNAELLTETRSRVKDLQLLHDVSLAAASNTHLKEALQAAAEALAAEWDGTQIALQLVDEQARVLRMVAGVGYVLDGSQDLDLPLGKGVTGWVAQRGEPVLVSDVRDDPRYYSVNPDTRSELCVPLTAGSGVLGTLNVESGEPDAFTLDDQ
ncbi:MAG: GAF domain-containing protein, partial [Chloroflexota bacterium]